MFTDTHSFIKYVAVELGPEKHNTGVSTTPIEKKFMKKPDLKRRPELWLR